MSSALHGWVCLGRAPRRRAVAIAPLMLASQHDYGLRLESTWSTFESESGSERIRRKAVSDSLYSDHCIRYT